MVPILPKTENSLKNRIDITVANLSELVPLSFAFSEASRALNPNGVLHLKVNTCSELEEQQLQKALAWAGFQLEPTQVSPNEVIAKKIVSDSKPKFEALGEFYEKISGNYDAIAEQGKYSVPKKLVEWMSDKFNQNFRALDLGCANGFIGQTMTEAGCKWQFYGIDFSAAMVHECQQRGLYRSALKADLNFGLPVVEDNIFNVVIATGVAEFIEDGAHLMSEVSRVLTRDGVVAITFEKTTPESVPRGEVQPSGVVKFHYSKNQVESLINNAGLKIEKYEEFDAYFSPTFKKWIPYHFVLASK